MHCHRLNRSLNITTRRLRKWNRECFGFAEVKIYDLEEELQILQNGDSDESRQLQIREELKEQRARLECIYKHKSRELWLQEMDCNTKFFHTSMLVKRRRNKIDAIHEESKWLVKEEKIVGYFRDKFEELFSSSFLNFSSDLDNLLSENITDEENNELQRIPSKEEIKECVWSLHPLKSLGPESFSSIFFRSYWTTVKERVCKFVK